MTSLSHSPAPEPGDLLLPHLGLVDRIVTVIGRRHALDPEELEEFHSWARERLLDGDCAILRKFGGRSSVATYLTVVLTNLFHDYRNQRWGRWRPSAAALRLGPLAIQLERMVYRDGCPTHQAIAAVRTAQPSATEAELAALVAQLPARTRSREVSLDAAELAASDASSDEGLWVSERERALQDTEAILERQLAHLDNEDRVIIRMRYWQEASVADIARALSLPQKQLYRRLEAIQARLRQSLEREGIGRDRVALLLDPEAAA